MTLFGRRLSDAWHRWKNCGQYKVTTFNGNFKLRLLKLYRGKLAKALNLWRMNRDADVIEL